MKVPDPHQHYVRRLDFCAMVGIGTTTFQKWANEGHLVISKPSARITLVHVPTAMAFLASKHIDRKPKGEVDGE